MANAREIKTKIKSVQSTKKITKAMEMVAVSKMKKAQDRMLASRPYALKIEAVIAHILKGNLEYTHPFTDKRSISRIGIIVASSDRGLCGGLNINLFRKLVDKMSQCKDKQIAVELCLIGHKAATFFKRFNVNIVGCVSNLGDKPVVEKVIGPVNLLLNKFLSKEIDELYFAHNVFINTMTQKATITQILPICTSEMEGLESKKEGWDYIYEPSAEQLLDIVLRRYIESEIYQGLVENFACEQAARMVAMKNASDNAEDLISDLELAYNKARQASITKELCEIVAGASVL